MFHRIIFLLLVVGNLSSLAILIAVPFVLSRLETSFSGVLKMHASRIKYFLASGQRLYLAHAYWNKVCSFASAILSVCCVFSENTSWCQKWDGAPETA